MTNAQNENMLFENEKTCNYHILVCLNEHIFTCYDLQIIKHSYSQTKTRADMSKMGPQGIHLKYALLFWSLPMFSCV